MKIVHIITGLAKASGVTTFVENVVREQRALGHEVEIVTNANSSTFQPFNSSTFQPFNPSTFQPSKLRTMGANGRKLVEEKYTWPAVCRAMLAGYEKVLEVSV